MPYIYHYCSFESCVDIINSNNLRLTRHMLNEDNDELFEGLQLLRSLLPNNNNESGLGKHLEEIIEEYAYYLASFTDNLRSLYHMKKYGDCILAFNKMDLDTCAWDQLGASRLSYSDSCIIQCCYDFGKNEKTIKNKIAKIKQAKSIYMKADIKNELVENILPKIKSRFSNNDQEYRIFVPKDKVQNDPLWHGDFSSPLRQSMPKVTVIACSAYIELSYGSCLKEIILPERYVNYLDKIRCANISFY